MTFLVQYGFIPCYKQRHLKHQTLSGGAGNDGSTSGFVRNELVLQATSFAERGRVWSHYIYRVIKLQNVAVTNENHSFSWIIPVVMEKQVFSRCQCLIT